jgi:hypothetical protein
MKWALAAALLAACGGDARVASLNNALRTLPAWETPRTVNSADTGLAAGDFTVGADAYTCTLSDPIELDPATTEFQDIMAPGLEADTLYPGALLQGRGVAEGRFDSLRLARAPITLTTTMNIAEPSITVDNPSSATMRDAIATLLRRGDSRTGAIDVTSGTVLMRTVEAFSFAQSLNQVGISTAYAGPVGSLQADFNYGSGRQANAHSVMVVLVQPLLRVSFSEDGLAAPADLLADSVTLADIDAERAAGRLGDDNVPVYVKSVTYGRVMMYTLTSTNVSSYSELGAAVEASYKGFTGSGEYTQAQRNIIANSQHTLISFGGPQDAAVAAIVELARYFVPMEPTQAVPISYELRDLRGNVAAVGDVTRYRRRDCGRRAIDYSWSINLSGIDDSAFVKVNGTQRGGDNDDARAIDLNPWTQPGNNDLEVVLYNNGLTGGSLQFELFRNGARVQHRNFDVSSPVCVGGCWYAWRFVYNDTNGVVSQIGGEPPR